MGFELAARCELCGFDAIDGGLIEPFLRSEVALAGDRFESLVASIVIEFPSVLVVLEIGSQEVDEFLFARFVFDGGEQFDTSVQGSWHPVGAGDEHSVLASMAKVQDTGVFEESVDDAHDRDVFA